MQVNRGKKQRKIPQAVTAILAVALMAGASLGIAAVWQNSQEGTAEGNEPLQEQVQDSVLSQQVILEGREGSGASQPEENPQDSPDEPGQDEVEQQQDPEELGSAARAGAVAQSPRVGNSYFEDAIFFGDSLSTGIPLYQVAGNPDTVAFTGITPDTINYSDVIPTPQGNKTVLDAALQYGDKKKVYIMLGANGLWMDDNSFVNGYQQFIDGVKEQYPGATIYLQSILPVTRTAYLTYETADNEVIEHFNTLVLELAQKNKVHYLDIAQVMKDEEGYLPDEASPYDGMHLTPEYYNKWFEYLKTHTVEEE